MNSNMNSIANEPVLQRKARIIARRNTRSSVSVPLSIIAEEDDIANLSSSSSASSCESRAAVKSRRRRANIIADPFHVTFTQVSYSFPHPPAATPTSCPSSPSSSCSSPHSSPVSPTSSLSTSPEPWSCDGHDDDDDVPGLSSTKPLVINKKPAEVDFDDELEEEYHYYTQEFNKILSLASLYSSVESQHPPRPESVCAFPRPRPASLAIVRPPPRKSLPVPADDDDSSDVLMYYMDDSEPSTASVYSTPSPFPEEEEGDDDDDGSSNVSLVDFEFEMDPSVRLRLPLSLPNSPIDLEADIREGLEELHASQENAWSFDESSYSHHSDEMMGGHTLKSKWSTSTLGSVKERSSSTSLASKVFPYFSPKKSPGGQGTASGRKRGFSFMIPTSPVPSTPSSMLFPQSPRVSREGARIRRRGSTSTNASADSGDSTSSSGLRRKPIPIELFMKA